MTITTDYEDGPPPLVDADDDMPMSPVAAESASTTAPDVIRGVGSRTDPAFAFCTPEFWSLIESVANSFPQPNHASAASIRRYNSVIKNWRATATLTDLAAAMGLPPEHTRVYLRAIHGRLESVGVTLRERRLKGDGTLGDEAWKYTGEFMWPAEKNALYHARGDAKRALAQAKAQADGGKADPSTIKALNQAQTALAEAEAEIAEMKATTEHLPIARHAFVVVIDPDLYEGSR